MKKINIMRKKRSGWNGGRNGFCLFCVIFCLVFLSGCQKEKQQTEPVPPISFRVPLVIKTEQQDFPMVQEAFASLVREKLGVAAELVFVDTNLKRNVVRMYRKQQQGFDLVNGQLIGKGMYQNYELLPLGQLLQEHGEGICRLFRDEEARQNLFEETALWVPAREDRAECACVLMRKDLLLEAGAQVSEMMSLQDVEGILSAVARRHPEMKIVAPEGLHLTFLYRFGEWLNLAGSAFVAMDYGRSGQAELLYATDIYRELVTTFYRWNKEGWIPDYMGPVSSAALVNSGELFSYFVHYKPGIEFQEGVLCGYEMVPVRITQTYQRLVSSSGRGWAITKDCRHPEEAMELLNFLYTDPDVMNLLMYGIEGVHYSLDEQGYIVPARGSGYVPGIGWALPNQYLCYRQEGEPEDLWGQIRRSNEEAIRGKALGFSFNQKGYEREMAEIAQVVEIYAEGLEKGVLDPEIYLPEFLGRLEEAGAGKVLEAVQQQYSQWLLQREGEGV